MFKTEKPDADVQYNQRDDIADTLMAAEGREYVRLRLGRAWLCRSLPCRP